MSETSKNDDTVPESEYTVVDGAVNYFPQAIRGGIKYPYPKQDAVDNDPVNHPQHYRSHPSGIECIQVTEHMGFNLGNAIKYLWRADLKNDAIEDMEKSVWYVQREIARRKKAQGIG